MCLLLDQGGRTSYILVSVGAKSIASIDVEDLHYLLNYNNLVLFTGRGEESSELGIVHS